MVTGNHELLKLNLFFLKKRGGGGRVRDYAPPVNSSEFLVRACYQNVSLMLMFENQKTTIMQTDLTGPVERSLV